MNINPNVVWCDHQTFHSEAAALIKSVSSVLDIGCGIRPQQYVIPELLICVEPHLEYVEILKKNLRDANAIVIPLDAKTALSALPSQSIDSIFLIDVIEHMGKDVGISVIKECERVARQQVIIFTPLGFMPQEIHADHVDGWNLHGGEWQDHKSGWYPEDFPDWHIIGCKHLHFNDYTGNRIEPPYGAFYAVKNIEQKSNYFNYLYSKDVIQTKTEHLNLIHEVFPRFVEQVVFHDIQTSNLKCGIQSCQRTTELFIEMGAAKTSNEIFELVEQHKSELLLNEARMHNDRIKQFATEFTGANERAAKLAERESCVMEKEKQLATHETNLKALEVDIKRRESWISEKEQQLANHETNLKTLEADIKRRESWISEKEQQLATHETNLKNLEVDIERRESWISEKEAQLATHETNLKTLEVDIKRRESWIIEKEEQLANHETNLKSLEVDIKRRESWISEKEAQLASHETNLNALEADFNQRILEIKKTPISKINQTIGALFK